MGKVRPIAICLFYKDGKVLAAELQDRISKEVFYRPLGGGIEFFEKSAQTLVREIKEEINADIENISLLGYIENLFEHEGEKGHEIVVVYNAEFVDKTFYQKKEIAGIEANGSPIKAVWKNTNYFNDTDCIIYPIGVLDLLNSKIST